MSTTVFKIGNTDFSGHVIAGSYDVQNKDIYDTYTDANRVEHRRFIRNKVVGSFDMFYKDINDYDGFVSAVNTARTVGRTVAITVVPNNTNTSTTINAYIEFAPVRNRKGNWDDFMERYTVNIEEA